MGPTFFYTQNLRLIPGFPVCCHLVPQSPSRFKNFLKTPSRPILGILIFVGNILIFGFCPPLVAKVTEVARTKNVKFNLEKLQYCVYLVKFVGFAFDRDKKQVKTQEPYRQRPPSVPVFPTRPAHMEE